VEIDYSIDVHRTCRQPYNWSIGGVVLKAHRGTGRDVNGRIIPENVRLGAHVDKWCLLPFHPGNPCRALPHAGIVFRGRKSIRKGSASKQDDNLVCTVIRHSMLRASWRSCCRSMLGPGSAIIFPRVIEGVWITSSPAK